MIRSPTERGDVPFRKESSGAASDGQNSVHGVGNFAEVGRGLARIGQQRSDYQQRGEERKNRRIGGRFRDGERVMLKRAPEGKPQQP